LLKFKSCNGSNTQQHWVVSKTGNDGKYVRVCHRQVENKGNKNASLAKPDCLTALIENVKSIHMHVNYSSIQLHPQKEEGDASQQWQVNSTTHQFASVQYPRFCITLFSNPSTNYIGPEECNFNGYQSSKDPRLTNKFQQSFYPKLTLVKQNEEKLCIPNF